MRFHMFGPSPGLCSVFHWPCLGAVGLTTTPGRQGTLERAPAAVRAAFHLPAVRSPTTAADHPGEIMDSLLKLWKQNPIISCSGRSRGLIFGFRNYEIMDCEGVLARLGLFDFFHNFMLWLQ